MLLKLMMPEICSMDHKSISSAGKKRKSPFFEAAPSLIFENRKAEHDPSSTCFHATHFFRWADWESSPSLGWEGVRSTWRPCFLVTLDSPHIISILWTGFGYYIELKKPLTRRNPLFLSSAMGQWSYACRASLNAITIYIADSATEVLVGVKLRAGLECDHAHYHTSFALSEFRLVEIRCWETSYWK